MASTAETSWTNITVDLLRSNAHVDCKQILKQLIPKTLEHGIRFVSRQSKVTEGVRNVRLDAWYYIRHVRVEDMLTAVSVSGFATEALRREIRALMETQRVYHVVIRGNDPDFMPLGVQDGQDVVTTYCCERLDIIHEEVDKYLFDELNDPQAVQQAMSDPLFDAMLEQYFLSGDTQNEETLRVVSRFRGAGNLLHVCIKEAHMESLRLLLSKYTIEHQGHAARWRVLAEPLRSVGKFKITAFHRAVYDGQAECLQELVLWAQQHGHDITNLRNVEERSDLGDPMKCLTCLELAEQENNLACYNILAPIFGLQTKANGTDANTREARLVQRTAPRVELAIETELEPLCTVKLTNMDWCDVLEAVMHLKALRRGPDDTAHAIEQLVIRLHNVCFLSDATEEQIGALFSETAGMLAIEAIGCTMKSDRTGLHCLKVIARLLSAEDGGHLPQGLPQKVQLSSPVAEELETDEERKIDDEVAELLPMYIEHCGKWPGFMGARNGLISIKQRLRLAGGDGFSYAASLAAIYVPRIFCFLGHPHVEDDAGLGDWIRRRELMPLARAVFVHFFCPERLLVAEFEDPGLALDAAVVHFLKMTLTAWFSTAPRACSEDAWRVWADRLRADEEVLKKQLAPALDLVLDALLRMWKVLNPACRQPRGKLANMASIGHLIKSIVPEPLLSRLPKTQRRLENHYASSARGEHQQRGRVNLLSAPGRVSLRPGGGKPRRG